MRVDIKDKKYGRLTVIEYAGTDKHRQALWKCKCDCGAKAVIAGTSLRRGLTRSCGCLHKEASKKPNRKTHGHAAPDKRRTRTYNIWNNMKQRCINPAASGYVNYGGRGIKVCERWMKFENFLADMGECPPNLTIDRINNDGDYEPNNCRWITRQEQNASGRRRPKTNHKEKLND